MSERTRKIVLLGAGLICLTIVAVLYELWSSSFITYDYIDCMLYTLEEKITNSYI